jgi:hypothetical protein
MRLATTQQLSDGDLFYIIEHGIRFTGMPGWRTGTTAGEGILLASRALHPSPADTHARPSSTR